MFSKRSRYKSLTDAICTDARGRSVKSKSPRLLPDTAGTFLHILKDKDRLDQLAEDYYKQPGKWWRICDANPQFKSPLALLGQLPVVTTRFPVAYTGPGNNQHPPWYKLLKSLARKTGVTHVAYSQSNIVVTYNRVNINAQDIIEAIQSEDADFSVAEPITIERSGKTIVIPPGL